MKVVLLSTFDLAGGAARAAFRLHQGLCGLGVDSQMLVQVKQSDDISVIGQKVSSATGQIQRGSRMLLNQLPVKGYAKRERELFSPQWLPDKIPSKINAVNPDVINLHWAVSGYLQIESIAKFKQPIVWTLHDMWAFTGGCHYNQTCDRYAVACGACPLLGSTQEFDISRWVWQRKAKAWKQASITVVALSNWMAQCIQKSSLLHDVPIEIIPNGLDTARYRPIRPEVARDILGLPLDKKLILSASLDLSEKRKGFHLLIAALTELKKTSLSDDIELMVFGQSSEQELQNIGFKVHALGTLHDDYSLALAYSAADVLVAPSLQDNLPNTVMESLACASPCVAFDIGGMPDMIEHQKNGYLANPFDVEDLTQGIIWVLENQSRYQNLALRSRQKVEQEFNQVIQSKRYASLFSSVLK